MRFGLGGGQDGEPTRVRAILSGEATDEREVASVSRRDVDPVIVIRCLVQIVQSRILVAPAGPVRGFGIRSGHVDVLGVVRVVGAERIVLLIGEVRLGYSVGGGGPVTRVIAIGAATGVVVSCDTGLRLLHEH